LNKAPRAMLRNRSAQHVVERGEGALNCMPIACAA
jgi:hypothetical protein